MSRSVILQDNKAILSRRIPSISNHCGKMQREDCAYIWFRTKNPIHTCLVLLVFLLVIYAAEDLLSNPWRKGSMAPKETQPQQQQQQQQQPWILLHFGPRKTATTSIQQALVGHEKELHQDIIVYIGHEQADYTKGAGQYLRQCVAPSPSNNDNRNSCTPELVQAWRNFEQQLESLARNGTNVVFSDEGIPRLDAEGAVVQLLERATRRFAGNRHVTVTHRPYMEWYLSEYNQSQKKRWTNKFVEGIVDWHRYGTRRQELLAPLTKSHVLQYEQIFDSVSIFDMHDYQREEYYYPNVVAAWVCTEMSAPVTCQALQRAPATASVGTNGSDGVLAARRLAQLVLSRGELDLLKSVDKAQLEEWTRHIHTWINEQEDDLPTTCLTTEEVDEIIQQSIQLQADLGSTNKILEHYDMDVARTKFCQIDYDRLKQIPEWIDFVALLAAQVSPPSR